MNYWLLKTEPTVYSIDDLARDGRTCWDGVRNFQARNYLRDQMKLGDKVLVYHSNAKPMAIVGVAEVVREGYPDDTAFDPNNHHFDPDSKKDAPTWFMVDIAFIEKFKRPITLDEAKADPDLMGMVLIQKGSRLSVQPVSKAHFEQIRALGSR